MYSAPVGHLRTSECRIRATFEIASNFRVSSSMSALAKGPDHLGHESNMVIVRCLLQTVALRVRLSERRAGSRGQLIARNLVKLDHNLVGTMRTHESVESARLPYIYPISFSPLSVPSSPPPDPPSVSLIIQHSRLFVILTSLFVPVIISVPPNLTHPSGKFRFDSRR